MKKDLGITEGPLFFKIFKFAIPIIFTGLLQICYTMADNIVVGRFSGDVNALGAVGSTGSLVNLTTQLLLGLSAGSSVVVAQGFGAKRESEVSRAVHTAMTTALVGGIFFGLLGIIISHPILSVMGTKPELFEGAKLYYRIICIGVPASALYNYGAAILRSVGDSKTPLIILGFSGLLNVILNLVFVIIFDMTVDGVAIATIASQYLSAILVIFVLCKRKNECYALSRKKFCFDIQLFKRILRLGVPAGVQSSLFGLSNVLMTSGINTLPIVAIKANPIASNIDSIAATMCGAFSSTAMTFIGQNYGAKKLDRIKKSFLYTIIQASVITLAVSLIMLIFAEDLAYIFIDADDPLKAEVAKTVKEISTLMLSVYFIGAIMDTVSAAVKALGYSITPMIISLMGICGLRIIWIYFLFPLEPLNSITGLFLIYPITWIITTTGHFITWFVAMRKAKKLFNS